MKPKQFFFFVMGLLVAVVAAGGYGFNLAFTMMNAKSMELGTRLAEQKAADEQMEKLSKLQFQYNRDVVPILPYVDDTLPHDKKQSEVLAQISRIAKNNGMALDSILVPSAAGLPSSVSQTVKAGAVLAMPINFKVRGNYAQLQNFTNNLESLNRFTNVTNLSVKRDGAGTGIYTYTVNAYVKP
jgi:Tfp pilus assembly protein PilO